MMNLVFPNFTEKQRQFQQVQLIFNQACVYRTVLNEVFWDWKSTEFLKKLQCPKAWEPSYKSKDSISAAS